jgi:hypothetical protein
MSDEKHAPGRRSASAEAAALRRGNPEDEEPELPPHIDEDDGDDAPRRSASAEAAALRYERDHPDDD